MYLRNNVILSITGNDVWLLSKPIKPSGMWYTKLNSIPNIDNVVSNKNTAVDNLQNDHCLTLVQNQDAEIPFSLNFKICRQKMLTVCKMVKWTPTRKPLPSFPCMTKLPLRRKRSLNSSHENQMDEPNNGSKL